MGFGSAWHWIVVLIVVLVLFGRGRVADVMGEFGKGLKSFKQGMNDEDNKPVPPPPAQIPAPESAAAPAPAPAASETIKTGE
ncbi:twin-arginine translocase TatA/TatE family subunit [Novosphingobium sp.]|uniref:twin-arginine translocase TatA/TatE family subunit n=1 Tax=Novosphingobium sp. TaxID=1874826 RepID=UPI00286DB425|nr:twin-arginine translocase TatA/TatE family subunit [Novosphingobium sp.]